MSAPRPLQSPGAEKIILGLVSDDIYIYCIMAIVWDRWLRVVVIYNLYVGNRDGEYL